MSGIISTQGKLLNQSSWNNRNLLIFAFSMDQLFSLSGEFSMNHVTCLMWISGQWSICCTQVTTLYQIKSVEMSMWQRTVCATLVGSKSTSLCLYISMNTFLNMFPTLCVLSLDTPEVIQNRIKVRNCTFKLIETVSAQQLEKILHIMTEKV